MKRWLAGLTTLLVLLLALGLIFSPTLDAEQATADRIGSDPIAPIAAQYDASAVQRDLDHADSLLALERAMSPIAEAYDIAFDIEEAPGGDEEVRWDGYDDGDLGQLRRGLDGLVSQIAQLSPDRVSAIEFASIDIAENLRNADGSSDLDGFVEFDVMVLSDYGEGGEGSLAATFAHEFGHILQSQSDSYSSLEDDFEALNTKGFQYGDHDQSEDPAAGFVSTYAMTAAAEDQAELFMFMFSSHHQVQGRELLREDPIVKAKVDLLLPLWQAFDPTLTI